MFLTQPLRHPARSAIVAVFLFVLLIPGSLLAQTSAPTATVVAAGLNVRSGPGVHYDRIGQVARNAELTVLGQAQNCAWLKVKLADDSHGWISGGAQYARLNVACDAIPAIAESDGGEEADGAPPVEAAPATAPSLPSATPDTMAATPTAGAPTGAPQLSLQAGTGLKERPAADIFAEISPAVAFLETPSGTGSGALVEHGFLLTNAHVVWPYDMVRVVFPDGSEFKEVPVHAWDLMADLALVGPIETGVTPIKLVDGGDLDIGSKVYLVGYPAEVEDFPQPSITNGILSRVRTWEGLDYDFFQVDATTVGGQSGGILVTHGGDVVGISTFFYRGFGLAGSVADALPRINALLGNDTGVTLDTRSFAAGPSATVVTGTLTDAMDSQVYVLRAAPKSTVDLQIEGIGRPQFRVASVGYGGYAFSEPLSRESKVAEASLTIEEESPYFVRVFQLSPNVNSYVLTSTHPLALYPDPDDGQELTVGATVVGNLDEPRDSDLFKITLAKDQVITISVDALKIDPAVAVIYDSDALRQYGTDDDSGGGIFDQNARLVYRAPLDDEYHIRVSNVGGNAVGGYFLRVEEAPGDAEVTELSTDLEIAGQAYGGLIWYESDENDFAVLYPQSWPPSSGCGPDVTACMMSNNAGLIISEESLETLPSRQRNREGYVSILQNMIASQPGVELLGSEVFTTTQRLSADRMKFSGNLGQMFGERLTYVDDEKQIAFSATVVMEADLYDTMQPLIDVIFDSFRHWNMENITDTAAFQLDQGMRLNLTREYTAALAAYTKAIEFDPSLDLAYLRRGWSYYDAQEDDKALADLREAVRLSPDDADVHRNYGFVLWALDRPEEAADAVAQAIALEPERYENYNMLAYVHAALGDFEAALADTEKASQLNHDELSEDVRDTRAYIYLLQGDPEAALADYNILLDKDIASPYALFGAGVAAMRSGDEARGQMLIDRGRAKLAEEIEKGHYRRLNPQLINLVAWADELYPAPAPE